jgi:rod shape-determining protein MreC
VRVAALGSPVQRSTTPPSGRLSSVTRRRVVVAVLVVLSLALVTIFFRESDSGPLHEVQNGISRVLHPFVVAAERVAQPFEDAAGWFGDLLDAKSENEKLRKKNAELRQQAVANEVSLRELEQLKALLNFREGPRFPNDYNGVAVRVIARAPANFEQRITIAAGTTSGIEKYDTVVTGDGLVGQVTRVAPKQSHVTLLSDQTSAVSVVDLKTDAAGILRHSDTAGGTLILDRVRKEEVVDPGDVIVTAGWRSGELSSLYPRGIPVGEVTHVNQVDIKDFKDIHVEPFVDFDSLEAVLVLVPKDR